MVIDRLPEMPIQNPREQHSRCAESDPAKLQAPQRHAKNADNREHADRMRDRLCLLQFNEPTHVPK
jgi:hypothetical protein